MLFCNQSESQKKPESAQKKRTRIFTAENAPVLAVVFSFLGGILALQGLLFMEEDPSAGVKMPPPLREIAPPDNDYQKSDEPFSPRSAIGNHAPVRSQASMQPVEQKRSERTGPLAAQIKSGRQENDTLSRDVPPDSIASQSKFTSAPLSVSSQPIHAADGGQVRPSFTPNFNYPGQTARLVDQEKSPSPASEPKEPERGNPEPASSSDSPIAQQVLQPSAPSEGSTVPAPSADDGKAGSHAAQARRPRQWPKPYPSELERLQQQIGVQAFINLQYEAATGQKRFAE